ncbi:hypothetical protein [Nonomuraea dietziae]|uniref:Uncharacterized protein n=1 Tax=Nonomuraea dietziae TaxID=65515 RepID=A0A7W5VF85_9ACTN|nr:hypothetical protein [Nonomuraea dietziae]MBB3733796.1 hypothetical protein [Nonomuraea dietziae]
MTTIDQPVQPGTVARYWGTASTIRQIDLEGIARQGVLNRYRSGPEPFMTVPLEEVVVDAEALRREFLADMNALSGRGVDGGTPGRDVTDVALEAQVWRGGYERPMFAVPNDYLGWCFLEVVAPVEESAGTVAVFDPRAGSAMTAMPGLPWGRQTTITPVPGSLAVIPGWLTCSIVPVEKGEVIVVVAATSTR